MIWVPQGTQTGGEFMVSVDGSGFIMMLCQVV